MRLNPVLAREVRQRMRGTRVVVSLTLFLALVAVVTAIAYGAATSNSTTASQIQNLPFDTGILDQVDGLVLPSDVTRIGQTLFAGTTFSMFLLLALMLPVIASASISGERERQTLVPLQVTPMRPIQIITGKFGASILFVLVLIVSAMPLLALSYTIGGIQAWTILKATLGLIAAAAVFTMIGILSSSLTRRSLTSVLLALTLSFSLVVGTYVVASVMAELPINGARHPLASRYPLLASPLAMVADLSTPDHPVAGATSPWTSISAKYTSPRASVLIPKDQQRLEGDAVIVGRFNAAVGNGANVANAPKSTWNWQLRSAIVQGALLVGAIFVAARRIRTPARSER